MFLRVLLLSAFVALAAGVTDPICRDDFDCYAPDCYCPSTEPPKSALGDPIPVEDLPQIVVLSFDDAITALLKYNYYDLLFDGNRVNKRNGCPISATFYVTHYYTDYVQLHDLVERNFEIASHSMTHRTPSDDWIDMEYDESEMEMHEVRQTLEYFGAMEPGSIVGARAPFLQTSGNDYYQVLQDNGFLYDNSRPTRKFLYNDTVDPELWGLWPFTMDYDYSTSDFLDCQIEPCPNNITYPGLWVVPMVDLVDTSGVECAMLDQCDERPETEEQALELLRSNFYARYNTNKSPLGLFTHASWFDGDSRHNFDAIIKFIDEILEFDDVFVLGIGQLVSYMQDPVPLLSLGSSYEPWCPSEPILPDCQPQTCRYIDPPSGDNEIIMESCVRCPSNYPWIGNPMGN